MASYSTSGNKGTEFVSDDGTGEVGGCGGKSQELEGCRGERFGRMNTAAFGRVVRLRGAIEDTPSPEVPDKLEVLGKVWHSMVGRCRGGSWGRQVGKRGGGSAVILLQQKEVGGKVCTYITIV